MKKRYRVEGSQKKRRGTPEYVIDCLHLPKDVVTGAELISLMGNRELEVRHFKGLLSYSDMEICLKAGKHRVRVRGTDLRMEYFTAEEVKIRGRIESIVFEEVCR